MQWLRSAASRGFAGAVMLALPVAVAGTIGFSEGIGGIGAALGTFPGGEQEEPALTSSPDGPEAIVLPVAAGPAPGTAPSGGGLDGGGAAPDGPGTGGPGGGGTGDGVIPGVPTPPQVPPVTGPGGGGGVPPAQVPSVDVGSSVNPPGPIRQLLQGVRETVENVLGSG